MTPMTPTELFLPQLIEGDTDASLELFGGLGDVRDPMTGHIGAENFTWWALARHMWLADRRAALRPVRVTRGGEGRCVVEVVLELQHQGRRVELPVALAGEEEGERLRRVRMYHSTWPLTGGHLERGPIIPPRDELSAGDVVGAYQDALARGDVEAILALFEPDAVVREPAGGAYVHATPEARRGFYGAILARGGIPLLHCSIVDDGAACALEYIVTRWGESDLNPQSGLAVYVRGAPGKLAAARIYDDVSPPE